MSTGNQESKKDFLQGDIYSNYLNQAAFPTIPVITCVYCFTHVPPLCLQQSGETGQAEAKQSGGGGTQDFPTIPVITCVYCFTHVPPLCLQQSGETGQAEAKQSGGGTQDFPTIPVITCVYCFTHVSPICLQQSGG
jgi:hypothetical protein